MPLCMSYSVLNQISTTIYSPVQNCNNSNLLHYFVQILHLTDLRSGQLKYQPIAMSVKVFSGVWPDRGLNAKVIIISVIKVNKL